MRIPCRPASTLWVILLVAGVGAAQAQTSWRSADPAFEWQFPRDHWAHPGYKTEWWYFTGQLEDTADSTKRFGYQFTFFRVGLAPNAPALNSAWAVADLVMGHAALTELATGEHRFSELVYRANGFLGGFPAPGDSLVAWSRAPAGTDGRWTLQWDGAGYRFTAADDRVGMALSLETRPRKPIVLQGPNGYSRKGAGSSAASSYYSFTRLATRGTVSIAGRTYSVAGESWMDKEFGSNQLTDDQVGWDWFSLRLDDGRDIMLYRLRDRDGSVDFARATLVSPDGTAQYVEGNEWVVTVLDRWRSPATDAVYPVRWRLDAPTAGVTLIITADVPNQENTSRLIPDLFYWEGSVRVTDTSGQRAGVGYVELTGYGSAAPPAI